MRRFNLTLLVGILLAPGAALSRFHVWDIVEIYSDEDGSVQYVELYTASNLQDLLVNHDLTATSDGMTVTYTIPNNVDAQTADRRLLFATPDYAVLPGAVPPDFTLPVSFFDPTAASITINFAGVDTLTFSAADLPTDRIRSLNADLTTSVNSPGNFAGQTGQLELILATGFE